MKTQVIKSFFKLDADKRAANALGSNKLDPAYVPHAKRPDLSWSFEGFHTPEDIGNYPSEQVAAALNATLEQFGKSLLASNASDWAYAPTDADVSLAAWFADHNSSKGGYTRAVTALTLAKFAEFYGKYMQVLCGRSAVAALGGAKLIETKFATVLAKRDVMDKMQGNIVELAEAVEISDSLELTEQFNSHKPVVEALLKLLLEVTDVPNVDAL